MLENMIDLGVSENLVRTEIRQEIGFAEKAERYRPGEPPQYGLVSALLLLAFVAYRVCRNKKNSR